MDSVSEKPALEVDEIHPSRPGGEGTGGEGTIEDADGEVLLPITASEEKEPALMHAVVDEELRSPVAEVAYPLAVVVDLDAVLGLADAALPQRSMSHLLAFHRFRKLRWKAKEVLGPGEYRDYAGGPPLGGDIGWRLERRLLRSEPRWASGRGGRRAGPRRVGGCGPEGGKGLLVFTARWPSTAAG
jgi:hypothetical protein